MDQDMSIFVQLKVTETKIKLLTNFLQSKQVMSAANKRAATVISEDSAYSQEETAKAILGQLNGNKSRGSLSLGKYTR